MHIYTCVNHQIIILGTFNIAGFPSCFGRGRRKIIISGDQIKKRASNTLFSGDYNYRNKENPLALRARIFNLFYTWEKSKSLFWGTNLKRGH